MAEVGGVGKFSHGGRCVGNLGDGGLGVLHGGVGVLYGGRGVVDGGRRVRDLGNGSGVVDGGGQHLRMRSLRGVSFVTDHSVESINLVRGVVYDSVDSIGLYQRV